MRLKLIQWIKDLWAILTRTKKPKEEWHEVAPPPVVTPKIRRYAVNHRTRGAFGYQPLRKPKKMARKRGHY